MKGVLLIIFSFSALFCSAQQTHFYELKEALQQPDNVRSLSLNLYNTQNKDTIIDLVKFKKINKIELSHLDSDFNYPLFLKTLSQLTLLDSLVLENCGLKILPKEIGGLVSLKYLKISNCRPMSFP
jgi:hypothetical protein